MYLAMVAERFLGPRNSGWMTVMMVMMVMTVMMVMMATTEVKAKSKQSRRKVDAKSKRHQSSSNQEKTSYLPIAVRRSRRSRGRVVHERPVGRPPHLPVDGEEERVPAQALLGAHGVVDDREEDEPHVPLEEDEVEKRQ